MIDVAAERSAWRLSWEILAIVLILGSSGCSDRIKTYPVALRVAFADGTTIEGAIVAFQSIVDEGSDSATYSAVGKVKSDGTCTMTTLEPDDGLVAGRHRATVGLPPLWGSQGQDPDESPAPAAPPLHPRFRNPNTSGIEFTVTPAGPNEFVIQLERP